MDHSQEFLPEGGLVQILHPFAGSIQQYAEEDEGQASDLVSGTRVIYELGMDRTGKMAVSSVRVVPAERRTLLPTERGRPTPARHSASLSPRPQNRLHLIGNLLAGEHAIQTGRL